MAGPREKRPLPHYRTRSGTLIKPRYSRADVKADAPPPGEFPFTRGIHETMYLGKPWTMRQYAGFGTAKETNERFKYLLEHGQTGLSLALDLPTQLGYDSDAPEALGEVGKVGVAIDSLADMEEIFDGIPLGEVSTSMTINGTAAILLAMYEFVAKKQGVAPEKITGTVQNDLLKEFGSRGAWIFPIEASLRLCCDIILDCAERLPRFNPISIASHYRDAGATPAEEMAYTLAAARSYVEECLRRGADIDAFAPRLSFFFYTYTNFFEEVAKYRAGRRLWARLVKDTFGAKDEESMKLRAAVVCGGHSLTRAEPLNNIARTTLETFAIACAGLQSCFTAAYDEAFAIPTELSARTALRVQQVVAYETEVTKTVDPLGGSYFVEALTDDMEAAIQSVLDAVAAQGGMVEALRSGWVQAQIARRAYEWQRAVESGEQVVVGVNKFKTGAAQDVDVEPLSATASGAQVEKLRVLRERRDAGAVKRTLANLAEAARGTANLMPAIRDCVAAYATVGEISSALRAQWGEYQPPTRF